MHAKLMLGLVLSVAVATSAFAQSGSKARGGSQSRSSNTTSASTMARKEAKALAKEETKLARQIAKSEFGKVKLMKKQKELLASLVHENFSELKQFDAQINNSIPADKAKNLAKVYRMATKKGESKAEAMASSMVEVGLNENIQQKILGYSESKAELVQEIRQALLDTFDKKQLKALADADAKMKAKTDEKEKT